MAFFAFFKKTKKAYNDNENENDNDNDIDNEDEDEDDNDNDNDPHQSFSPSSSPKKRGNPRKSLDFFLRVGYNIIITVQRKGGTMKKFRYSDKGMTCAACVAHVERAAAKVVGEDARSVSLLTNSLTVTLPDDANEHRIFGELRTSLKAVGYDLLEQVDLSRAAERAALRRDRARLWASFRILRERHHALR